MLENYGRHVVQRGRLARLTFNERDIDATISKQARLPSKADELQTHHNVWQVDLMALARILPTTSCRGSVIVQNESISIRHKLNQVPLACLDRKHLSFRAYTMYALFY